MEREENLGPPPASAPEKVEKARSFCVELLRRMGAQVVVEARESVDSIAVSLNPAEGNKLELGSATIEAVQYLVNRVVNPRAEGRKWVNLDVGGFKDDADPVVKAMAERLAASAKAMGKVLAVGPISARERRQIHLALVGVDGIATRSEGEGIFRQLLIIPGKKGGRPGSP